MAAKQALIIDDNRGNLDVLSMLLAQQGVIVTAVQSIKQVSFALETVSPDVVFLDLEFPNGSGFDVLTDLKANPLLAGVPVVAYTVHVSEIDVTRRAGFDSFLGKPLDSRKFPDQLRRILSGQAVWEAS
ncbi:MAG: response regulator [Anaerolineae bacterium]|jgi:two-component system cell cycle response regulator DivK|nr:response regulator [Anaerolineae bacterium]